MGIHSYPDARRVLGELGSRSFMDALTRDLQRRAASATTVLANPLGSGSPSLPAFILWHHTTQATSQWATTARSGTEDDEESVTTPLFEGSPSTDVMQGPGAAEAAAATRCASYISSYMEIHGLISDNEHGNMSMMSQVLEAYMQQNPTSENIRIGMLVIQDMNNRFSRGAGMNRELLNILAQSHTDYIGAAQNLI